MDWPGVFRRHMRHNLGGYTREYGAGDRDIYTREK